MTLAAWLHPSRPPRVLLVGDMMLDRYHYGQTERVSPEAPVMVLTATREELLLGGCGNVAANLAALGAQVTCVAVIGRDESAGRVRELLARAGLQADALVEDPSRPTSRKTRVVSGSQQLLRIDEEQVGPLGPQIERAVLARIDAALPQADIVVVSDYGKGVLTPAVLERLCRGGGKARVLVDPKGRDYAKYKGAHVITPNKLEAETATGIVLDGPETIRRAALELCRIADLHAAVITLGARGMYCCLADGSEEWSVPAVARSVFDVTGAGDTVLAVMAFALATGAALPDAMRLATVAAGIVVERFGVVAVTPRRDRAHPRRVCGRRPEAAGTRGAGGAPRRRAPRGPAHRLHQRLLRRAARRAPRVSARGARGRRPARRRRELRRLRAPPQGRGPAREPRRGPRRAALGLRVRLAGHDLRRGHAAGADPRPVPRRAVKGADWKDKGVVGADWVEAHGGRVVLARVREGYSSTETLRRLGAQERC